MSVLFTRRGPVPSQINFVDYIQCSGTQFFDTGFKPNQDTRVVMDAHATEVNKFYFGARTSTDSKTYCFCQTSSTAIRADYGTSKVSHTVTNTLDRVTIDKNKGSNTWGSYSFENAANTFQCDYSMFLLAANTAGTASACMVGYLCSCQIYDNGSLVRDYRPCLDPSGVACLYDLVNEEYVYNAGSGEFTVG